MRRTGRVGLRSRWCLCGRLELDPDAEKPNRSGEVEEIEDAQRPPLDLGDVRCRLRAGADMRLGEERGVADLDRDPDEPPLRGGPADPAR